jgi:hypothetical protein
LSNEIPRLNGINITFLNFWFFKKHYSKIVCKIHPTSHELSKFLDE